MVHKAQRNEDAKYKKYRIRSVNELSDGRVVRTHLLCIENYNSILQTKNRRVERVRAKERQIELTCPRSNLHRGLYLGAT